MTKAQRERLTDEQREQANAHQREWRRKRNARMTDDERMRDNARTNALAMERYHREWSNAANGDDEHEAGIQCVKNAEQLVSHAISQLQMAQNLLHWSAANAPMSVKRDLQAARGRIKRTRRSIENG